MAVSPDKFPVVSAVPDSLIKPEWSRVHYGAWVCYRKQPICKCCGGRHDTIAVAAAIRTNYEDFKTKDRGYQSVTPYYRETQWFHRWEFGVFVYSSLLAQEFKTPMVCLVWSNDPALLNDQNRIIEIPAYANGK